MKIFFACLIFFELVVTSCRDGKNESHPRSTTQADSIVRDMPEWYAQSSLSQKMDRESEESLKLESLRNGFNGLQIRIWISCGYRTSSLIKLTKQKLRWNAAFYWFKMHLDSAMFIKAEDLKFENRLPRSGWEKFSADLISTGIIDLQDQTKLKAKHEYFEPTDADEVRIEIGLPGKYRLYEYSELGYN